MSGLLVLDTAISVIFLVLLFSIFATSGQEAISQILAWRAAALRALLKNILEDELDRFLEHPQIRVLLGPAPFFGAVRGTVSSNRRRAPSAIDPIVFARALIEIAQDSKALLPLIESIKGQKTDAEEAVAHWFNASMDRVSGWYKRRAQLVLFLLGFGMAAATNADLVAFARHMAQDEAARQALLDRATAIALQEDLAQAQEALNKVPTVGSEEPTPPVEAVEQLEKLITEFSATSWLMDPAERSVANVPGWLLMALGVMLGAQFWFDLLKRFVSLRAAVSRGPADT
ncbi:MAG: hypothetical protein AAGA70_18190 [Pseudomonadota bacterium]